MLSALARLIDRRPWWVLAIALAITAVAVPIGIHVRDDLKPRGFDVAGSSSAEARKLVAKATDTDPANSVLALVRLPAPYGAPSAEGSIEAVEAKLRRDPAVAAVLDATSAHNPAWRVVMRRIIACERRTPDALLCGSSGSDRLASARREFTALPRGLMGRPGMARRACRRL